MNYRPSRPAFSRYREVREQGRGVEGKSTNPQSWESELEGAYKRVTNQQLYDYEQNYTEHRRYGQSADYRFYQNHSRIPGMLASDDFAGKDGLTNYEISEQKDYGVYGGRYIYDGNCSRYISADEKMHNLDADKIEKHKSEHDQYLSDFPDNHPIRVHAKGVDLLLAKYEASETSTRKADSFAVTNIPLSLFEAEKDSV